MGIRRGDRGQVTGPGIRRGDMDRGRGQGPGQGSGDQDGEQERRQGTWLGTRPGDRSGSGQWPGLGNGGRTGTEARATREGGVSPLSSLLCFSRKANQWWLVAMASLSSLGMSSLQADFSCSRSSAVMFWASSSSRLRYSAMAGQHPCHELPGLSCCPHSTSPPWSPPPHRGASRAPLARDSCDAHGM